MRPYMDSLVPKVLVLKEMRTFLFFLIANPSFGGDDFLLKWET